MKKTNNKRQLLLLDIILGMYAVVYFSIGGFTPYFILGMVGVIPFWIFAKQKYKE